MRQVLNGDNYEPAAEAEDGLLKKVSEAPDAAAGDVDFGDARLASPTTVSFSDRVSGS